MADTSADNSSREKPGVWGWILFFTTFATCAYMFYQLTGISLIP